MSKPINLRQARKQKARDDKRKEGDANAARFGQTKGESARLTRLSEIAESRLDGAKREK